jgi:hypothetical protein
MSIQRSSILQNIANYEVYAEKEIAYWKAEAKHWEAKYWESVLGAIKHNEAVMGSFMQAVLEGVVAVKPKDSGKDSDGKDGARKTNR